MPKTTKMEGKSSPRGKKARPSPKPESSQKPARPLNPYNYFFCEQRKQILAEREEQAPEDRLAGKKLFSAMGKSIAERWRALPDTERAKYKALANQDKARFMREKEEYHQKELNRLKKGLVMERDHNGSSGGAAFSKEASSSFNLSEQESGGEVFDETNYNSDQTSLASMPSRAQSVNAGAAASTFPNAFGTASGLASPSQQTGKSTLVNNTQNPLIQTTTSPLGYQGANLSRVSGAFSHLHLHEQPAASSTSSLGLAFGLGTNRQGTTFGSLMQPDLATTNGGAPSPIAATTNLQQLAALLQQQQQPVEEAQQQRDGTVNLSSFALDLALRRMAENNQQMVDQSTSRPATWNSLLAENLATLNNRTSLAEQSNHLAAVLQQQQQQPVETVRPFGGAADMVSTPASALGLALRRMAGENQQMTGNGTNATRPATDTARLHSLMPHNPAATHANSAPYFEPSWTEQVILPAALELQRGQSLREVLHRQEPDRSTLAQLLAAYAETETSGNSSHMSARNPHGTSW